MSQRRPSSWQEMRDQEIKWLIERTGQGLETWNARVRESGFNDEASLRKWLEGKGVTGYPAMLLVMERFGYPDYLHSSADELIENQYGDRPGTRPILDTVLGLRLPASQPAQGRLETARNFPQSSVTHKIALAGADDVDDEVVGWIKRSYAENK